MREPDRLLGQGHQLRWQISRGDELTFAQQDRAFDYVLQFAHVAGPIVTLQNRQRFFVEAADFLPDSPVTLRRKCSASSGISLARSRRFGSSILMTLMR